jgi:hypothetical protein
MLEQTPERNKKDEMKENPRLLNKAKAAHKPGAPVRKTRKATTVAVTIAVSFSLLFCTRAEGQDPNTDARSSDSDLQRQILQLRALVQELQSRVSELEKHSALRQEEGTEPGSPEASTEAAQSAAAVDQKAPLPAPAFDLLRGTTLNLLFDGYYGYDFNNPIGRVNLLRAYDVSSNAFSLNQADLVLENAVDLTNGKRFGARLDFQYGQATATLQGNAVNEPRPGIYQNIFQAYGTYVFPLGRGLTVDFGKFASSLGIEGNYTKDQINYSRSLWFAFLPFYHMGVRTNYAFNDKFAVNYWIVNGTQQTEPFNGFKDQFAGVVVQPAKAIAWTVNYYLGQEHPNVIFFPDGGAPAGLPTEQGVPFEPISNPPTGKLHIVDSYVTWQATPKLTLAGEGDYVIERKFTSSPPAHTAGGALYTQYQLTSKFYIAGRAEYLSDRGGLFTGVTQAVKEATFTTKYAVANGCLLFGEWRRDFANQPYFYSDLPAVLKKQQSTATLGAVWWFGAKQGAW